MGETGLSLRWARERAIALLGDHLTGVYHANRLKATETRSHWGHFHAGWEIILEVDGNRFELVLLAGDTFPFEPPQLYFSDSETFLRFPHVDEKGKLCLTNAVTTFSPNRVTETADFLIVETRRLISDSLAGRNEDDFVQEFQNYWRRLPAFSNKNFWSLLQALPPTRCLYYYSANGFTLFGDSDDEIEAWLKNYNGGNLPEGFNTKTTVVIWLCEPLVPKEYPKTAHDILVLAYESVKDADALLETVIPHKPGALPVLLGFETKTGPVMAGVTVPEPRMTKGPNLTQQRTYRNDGFRAGRVPSDVLIKRYFGGAKLSYHEVMPVNAAWCLQRGSSGHDLDLQCKRVAIVGCGSLGAEVAMMLAKSGVGGFVLIDKETLSWANVARHLLGGESVGQPKASALARLLTRQLPWITVSAEPGAVEELVYERPKTLQECDLIISTTGDWTSDCILNSALRTFAKFPPILFGWTEAYGLAGHALAVLHQGGCLACGTNEFGVFESRVTDWADGQQPLVQVTGCSDFYQPYGVVDVAPTKAIIAELALDVLQGRTTDAELRTWVGDTRRLHELGGQFGPIWRDKIIPGESIRRISIQAWPVNPKCPLCT